MTRRKIQYKSHWIVGPGAFVDLVQCHPSIYIFQHLNKTSTVHFHKAEGLGSYGDIPVMYRVTISPAYLWSLESLSCYIN